MMLSPEKANSKEKIPHESSSLAKADCLSTAKATGLAIFPGVLVHGLGHLYLGQEEAFWKLFYLEGIGFGGIVAGFVPLAFTGAAGSLAPVYVPLIAFGFFAFFTSWVLDIMGVLNFSEILSDYRDPYRRTFLEAAYIFHNDTETPFSDFQRLKGQLSYERFFFNIYYEREGQDRYQKSTLQSGFNIYQKGPNSLHLILEFNKEDAQEGFAIAGCNSFLEIASNAGFIGRSLKGLYIVNGLGFGRQWFFFGEDIGWDKSDISFSSLNLKHGFRLNMGGWISWESFFYQTHESIVGGMDFVLGVFEHRLEFFYKNLFFGAEFLHGRGYRFSLNLGVQL